MKYGLGNSVRLLRSLNGYTVFYFATMLGITDGQVERIESGEYTPTTDEQLEIACALSVEAWMLWRIADSTKEELIVSLTRGCKYQEPAPTCNTKGSVK